MSIALPAAAQVSEPPRPNLEKTEQLLGVLPEVLQLQRLSTSAAPQGRWQILWLHEQITERVLHAYLEFDATNAQIDTEMTRADDRTVISPIAAMKLSRAPTCSASLLEGACRPPVPASRSHQDSASPPLSSG
ncbi:MAG: hypothetical protein ACLPH3_24985 [Terracidiphilus sp.]